MAVFFTVEIIVIGAETGSPKFFIYLGDLAFTVFAFYTVWSAFSVTFRFLLVHVCCKERFSYERADDDEEESNLHNEPAKNCGIAENDLSWYQKVQWFLFTIGAEMAVAATVIYWSLVHKVNSGFIKPQVNVPIHLLNAVVAILDTWLANFPIRILHVVYVSLFGAGYQVFTGIYYAVNGTDIYGRHHINHILNYKSNPGVAVVIDFVIPFIFIPIVHLFFFLQYLLREGLLHLIKHKCLKRKRRQPLSLSEQTEADSVPKEEASNPFEEELSRELEQEKDETFEQ